MAFKKISGFFTNLSRLVRLPNLLIIILTQFLLRYSILKPIFYTSAPEAILPMSDFLILVLITLLLTISGYIINDYFDARIDSVNKPQRIVIGSFISQRGAIKWHILLTILATLAGLYLGYRIRSWTFSLIFPFIAILLWLYSLKYKRMLFWGNFIVSVLTAFVILVVWLLEFFHLRLDPEQFAIMIPDLKNMNRLFLAIAMFAFLISMIREIVKDVEDIEGDAEFGCRTIPIVIGIQKTRILLVALCALVIILIAFGQVVLWNQSMMMVFWYALVVIQLPLAYFCYRLIFSKDKHDFHFLSQFIKIIMVAGILTLQLIKISFA